MKNNKTTSIAQTINLAMGFLGAKISQIKNKTIATTKNNTRATASVVMKRLATFAPS